MSLNASILLHENDGAAVALRDIRMGETILIEELSKSIKATEDITKGHKFAVKEIAQGDNVLKFGYSIGIATEHIMEGSWIHTHNLKTGLNGLLEYSYEPDVASNQPMRESSFYFNGYVRENGEAGIRNEIWIINTVGCINKTCEHLAKMGGSLYGDRIDGIYHFSHPYGCSQLGDDLTYTQTLLASLANHPNAAGILVVGLGCENNQIEEFKKVIGEQPAGRIKFLTSQEVDDEFEVGMELIGELVEYAEQFKRQSVPVSKLKIGLKCGGSDGLSGITGNPLAGMISDWIISEGGTSILTEVPEMFGAETILMNRAANEEVFRKIVHLVNDFKEYFIRHGQEIYENPSPGNKRVALRHWRKSRLAVPKKEVIRLSRM